jgi:hypothetical protein
MGFTRARGVRARVCSGGEEAARADPTLYDFETEDVSARMEQLVGALKFDEPQGACATEPVVQRWLGAERWRRTQGLRQEAKTIYWP